MSRVNLTFDIISSSTLPLRTFSSRWPQEEGNGLSCVEEEGATTEAATHRAPEVQAWRVRRRPHGQDDGAALDTDGNRPHQETGRERVGEKQIERDNPRFPGRKHPWHRRWPIQLQQLRVLRLQAKCHHTP